MNEFSRAIIDGFKEARRMVGVDFTVNAGSTVYRGVERSREEMLMLSGGGFMEDFSGGLEFLADDVTITIGSKVTFGGNTYRVASITGDSGDPCRVAVLIGKDK